jgi:hypothetical protein
VFIEHESLFFKYISTTGKANRLFLREGDNLNLREKSGKFKEHPIRPQLPVINVIKSLYPKPDDLPEDFLYLIPLLYYISPPVISLRPDEGRFDTVISGILSGLSALEKKQDKRFQTFSMMFVQLLGLNEMNVREIAVPYAGPEEKVHVCTIRERAGGPVKSIEKFSDATKRLFILLYHLLIDTERLICIEEIEAGLHPHVLERLVPLFMQRRVPAQALVTTHSPFLLDLVTPENVFVGKPAVTGGTSFTCAASIKHVSRKLKNKHTTLGGLFVRDFKVE